MKIIWGDDIEFLSQKNVEVASEKKGDFVARSHEDFCTVSPSIILEYFYHVKKT